MPRPKPLSECVYAFVTALPTHAHGHPTEAERADLLARLRKEPDMQRLKHRERAALAYIRAYTTEHGYPPSRREISVALGYQSFGGSVQHVLHRLRDKGCLSLTPGASRAIRLRDEAS